MPAPRRKSSDSPAVRRMPSYLDWLLRMRGLGKRTVSTTELADGMKLGWTVVRKDVALVGVAGRTRVGYDVDRLVDAMRAFLGWKEPHAAALVGAGALGTAILGCDELAQGGLRVDAVFDSDPAKIGTNVRGHAVLPLSDLPDAFRRSKPEIGVLCVPPSAAQDVADLLVRHGVRYLWNFSGVALEVPEDVFVRRGSFAAGLAAISARILEDRAARVLPRARQNARKRKAARPTSKPSAPRTGDTRHGHK